MSKSLTAREVIDKNDPIILHIDIISQHCNIPPINGIYLTLDSEFTFMPRLDPNRSRGLYLLLPASIASFLSFEELQVAIHCAYISHKESPTLAISKLLKTYKPELALATVLKLQSFKRIWEVVLTSNIYLELATNSPEEVFPLIESSIHDLIRDSIRVVLAEEKYLKESINSLSDEQINHLLDLASTISENQVFKLDDQEYSNAVSELFYAEATQRKVS